MKGIGKMRNKHIELVKKWLADKDSVSRDELIDELVTNEDAARAAYDAAKAVSEAADAAYDVAYAANVDAYAAASDAYAAYVAADDAYEAGSDVSYWVKRYEELTK
jgi:hypothetical protein